jgi:hypothetical protein
MSFDCAHHDEAVIRFAQDDNFLVWDVSFLVWSASFLVWAVSFEGTALLDGPVLWWA